jgi:hypothetical protein
MWKHTICLKVVNFRCRVATKGFQQDRDVSLDRKSCDGEQNVDEKSSMLPLRQTFFCFACRCELHVLSQEEILGLQAQSVKTIETLYSRDCDRTAASL